MGLYVIYLDEASKYLPVFPYKYVEYDDPDTPAYVWVQAKRDNEGEEKDENSRWVQHSIFSEYLGDRLGQQYHKTKKAKDYYKGLMKVVQERDKEKPARTQNVGDPEELYRKQERRNELGIESGWEKYAYWKAGSGELSSNDTIKGGSMDRLKKLLDAHPVAQQGDKKNTQGLSREAERTQHNTGSRLLVYFPPFPTWCVLTLLAKSFVQPV